MSNSSPSNVYYSSPNVLLLYPKSGQKWGSPSRLTNELCFCFRAKGSQQDTILISAYTHTESAHDFRSSENSIILITAVPHLLKRRLLVNTAIWHIAINRDRNSEVLLRSKYLLQSPWTFLYGISGNSPKASFLGIENKKKNIQGKTKSMAANHSKTTNKKRQEADHCTSMLSGSSE